MIRIPKPDLRREATEHLIELSGQNVKVCLQCGKCTSGCPFAEDMDYTPHQIVHLVQLGLIEELMDSEAIWICATCFTCHSRCPVAIDIAALSDAIRLLAYNEKDVGIEPYDIPVEVIKKQPQQALVSLYRKFSR